MNDAKPKGPVGRRPARALDVTLWVVQGLLFVTFAGGALWKVLTPLPTIAGMMPWVGEVPPAFFYFTAAVDLAGGLGILLPSLLRLAPSLTVPAAVGCVALQVSAIVFHVSRGEAADTPFNFVLVALSGCVAWGRHRVPIPARA